VGPVTALAGVCLQDVERGAHEGGKRLLASRLRPVSSKATHPPTYLPLHNHRATPPTAALPAGVPALPLALTVVLAGWPRRVVCRSAVRSNSCGTAPVPVFSGDPRTALVALVSEAPSPSGADRTLISCAVAGPQQPLFLDVSPGVAAMPEQSIVQDNTPLDTATAAGRGGRLLILVVLRSCDGNATASAAGDIIFHASGRSEAVGNGDGRFLSADTFAGGWRVRLAWVRGTSPLDDRRTSTIFLGMPNADVAAALDAADAAAKASAAAEQMAADAAAEQEPRTSSLVTATTTRRLGHGAHRALGPGAPGTAAAAMWRQSRPLRIDYIMPKTSTGSLNATSRSTRRDARWPLCHVHFRTYSALDVHSNTGHSGAAITFGRARAVRATSSPAVAMSSAAVRLPAVVKADVDHYIALVKWFPQASDVDVRPSTERDVANDSDSLTIDEVLCVGRRFPAHARWAGGMLMNSDDGGTGKLFGRVGGGFHALQSIAHSSFLDVASAGS